MRSFDQASLRADFPILSQEHQGKPLVYLDNGATSQKPQTVLDRLTKFYTTENSNIHRGVHRLSQEATDAYERGREEIKIDLGLPGSGKSSHELIFVRGATEAINLVTHGLREQLQEDDEIILTVMEHHANFVPWQVLAQETGATITYIEPLEDGSLDLDVWKAAFTAKTRVAAFTHVSNVLGTVNPAAEMVRFASEHEVITLVDGAQALPHGPVDIGALDPDFYVFSGHKVYGPDGTGVLLGRRELLNAFPPYQTGGDMIDIVAVEGSTFREAPSRFEAGTPNISGGIALAEAFRYMRGIDWEAAHEHEVALLAHATEELEKMEGMKIFGKTVGKAPIVSFVLDWAHAHDVGQLIDTANVAIRVGHHCCQPLMTHLGVPATARASFAFYNNHDDVEALVAGLHKVKRFLS